jgi:hypothetical protein
MSMAKILTRYDPPEKNQPAQKMTENADIWSIGVVLFDCIQTLKMGYIGEGNTQVDFRELSEDGRRVLIK